MDRYVVHGDPRPALPKFIWLPKIGTPCQDLLSVACQCDTNCDSFWLKMLSLKTINWVILCTGIDSRALASGKNTEGKTINWVIL